MFKEKAEQALKLKEQYARAYENDFDLGKKLEMQYLELRRQILDEVDGSITRQRSLSIKEVKRLVAEMPQKPKVQTGIIALDRELVEDEEKNKNISGGMTVGNYIQIVGSRGSGKSTFLMKIMTNLSLNEKVCWFDFEMGKRRVIEKLGGFEHDDENLLYYNADRDINEITDEIKLLNASGVQHFVIDSVMKITTKEKVDRYEKFSGISRKLSELCSTLNINIYMVNQLSQNAESEGKLSIKHGNDVEYDSDYIFFILKKRKMINGRVSKDQYGFDLYDENLRIITCVKNRQDERLFSVEINKNDIFSKAKNV